MNIIEYALMKSIPENNFKCKIYIRHIAADNTSFCGVCVVRITFRQVNHIIRSTD